MSQITCKQAVDYISRKEEGKISFAQRIALCRHLVACSLCRIFSRQNKIITQAMIDVETRDLTSTEKQQLVRNVIESE